LRPRIRCLFCWFCLISPLSLARRSIGYRLSPPRRAPVRGRRRGTWCPAAPSGSCSTRDSDCEPPRGGRRVFARAILQDDDQVGNGCRRDSEIGVATLGPGRLCTISDDDQPKMTDPPPGGSLRIERSRPARNPSRPLEPSDSAADFQALFRRGRAASRKCQALAPTTTRGRPPRSSTSATFRKPAPAKRADTAAPWVQPISTARVPPRTSLASAAGTSAR